MVSRRVWTVSVLDGTPSVLSLEICLNWAGMRGGGFGQSLSDLGQGINLSILQRPIHQTLSLELEYKIGKG